MLLGEQITTYLSFYFLNRKIKIIITASEKRDKRVLGKGENRVPRRNKSKGVKRARRDERNATVSSPGSSLTSKSMVSKVTFSEIFLYLSNKSLYLRNV